MKLLVNEMPKEKKECPYSKFVYYPPCFEEIGEWYCKFTNEEDVRCNLSETECRWLKKQ